MGGSWRRNSVNQRLPAVLTQIAPAHLQLERMTTGDSLLSKHATDAAIKRVHAVVFVKPEHDCSIPRLMNNAIDQGPRPLSQNAWNCKPAGSAGVCLGPLGTVATQQHPPNMPACLDTPTMTQRDVYPQYKESLLKADAQIGAGARKLDEAICLLGRTAFPLT